MKFQHLCLSICLSALVLLGGSRMCGADPPANSLAAQSPPIPTNPVQPSSSTSDKYEFVSYGTFIVHANNLDKTFKHTYLGTGNWTARLLALGRDHPTTIRPYLVLYPAAQGVQDGSQDKFNNDPSFFGLAYGVGAEQRPLSRYAFGETWDWISRIRLYTEYLGSSTLAGKDPSGTPLQDWSVGFDLWREYGFVDPENWKDKTAMEANQDRFWAELYMGVSYHTTNFSRSNYDGIRSGASLTGGGRWGSTSLPLMPYLYLQVDSSSRYSEDYFVNRMVGGMGLRTERHLGSSGKVIFFVEYRGILAYLKSHPLFNNVPNSEWRGGVTYQISRY